MRKKEVASEDETGESLRPEPRAPSTHPTLRLALERALAELTRHQRDVFLLYEVEGFHHSEIAAMLEITEAASKNTLFRRRKIFAECWNLRAAPTPPEPTDEDSDDDFRAGTKS